jgi:hypothetical protein
MSEAAAGAQRVAIGTGGARRIGAAVPRRLAVDGRRADMTRLATCSTAIRVQGRGATPSRDGEQWASPGGSRKSLAADAAP